MPNSIRNPKPCASCGKIFAPKRREEKVCSRSCAAALRWVDRPDPDLRPVVPPQPITVDGEVAWVVQLARRGSTIVSPEDLPLALERRWSGTYLYPACVVRIGKKKTTIYLHRLILNAPKGVEVDHVNNDKFDNRRSNLRLVTRSQNEQNKRCAPTAASGYRGVYIARKGATLKFRAALQINGRIVHLGTFNTAEEAAQVAAEGRRRYMTHAPECEGP